MPLWPQGGKGKVEKTAIGYLPAIDALDLSGINISNNVLRELFKVDQEEWKHEIKELRDYFAKFEDKLPEGLKKELNELEERLLSE